MTETHPSPQESRSQEPRPHETPVDRVRRMETVLAEARAGAARLEGAAEELSRVESMARVLDEYHSRHWRADRERLEGTPQGESDLLSEDAVWDAMTRYRAALEELAERSARALARWDEGEAEERAEDEAV